MTTSKEPTSTQLHPTLVWFKGLFKAIGADGKSLLQRLEKAQAIYTKLMLAYQLTSIYEDITRTITWPPELEDELKRAMDIIQQLKEYSEALVQAGAEYEAATRIEVRTCPIIRQDYRAAANCVQRYLDSPPQTDEEWTEYKRCIDKLSLHASEMESHNCSL